MTTKEIPIWFQVQNLHCDSSQILEEVAQRDCAMSVLGYFRTQLLKALSKWICFEHGSGQDEFWKVTSYLN